MAPVGKTEPVFRKGRRGLDEPPVMKGAGAFLLPFFFGVRPSPADGMNRAEMGRGQRPGRQDGDACQGGAFIRH